MDYKKKTNLNSRDCIIKGINEETGEVDYFLNVTSAAKSIGCCRSQAYNVLNKVGYFKTAKGWKLEWVDFNDISIKNTKN